MKKYTTLNISSVIEKKSIELIWDLLMREDISDYSLITVKLENGIIKGFTLENEYEKVEKGCEENKLEMKKMINKISIYNEQEFLLME